MVSSAVATDRGDTPASLRLDTSASATAARVVVSLLFAKCHPISRKAPDRRWARRIAINVAKLPDLLRKA